jgi:outer membrane immunogenic protein
MLRYAFAALVAAGLGLSGAARAADLIDTPEPEYIPPALWTGFYVGVHGGYGWGKVDVGDTYSYDSPDPFKASSFEPSGGVYGVQFGYNHQNGNFVYGLEAELGYMNLSGSTTAYLPPDGCDERCDLHGTYSLSGGFYGDLALRLGYAQGNSLFYVKGGPAFLLADLKTNYVGENWSTTNANPQDDNPSTFSYKNNDALFGWTVGVGAEYAISSSLSLKAEYQYFNFGSTSIDHNGTDQWANWDEAVSTLQGKSELDTSVSVVKVGLNYQIGKEDELK